MSEEVPQNRGNIDRLIKEQLLIELKMITGRQKGMSILILEKQERLILSKNKINARQDSDE